MNSDLDKQIVAAVRRALDEDLGPGDVTTNALVPSDVVGVARVVAKEDGIVSGVTVAQEVFLQLDRKMVFDIAILDGEEVKPSQTLIELKGSAKAILTGERTALNFIGRMSGIATLTRKFVDATRGTNAVIVDTRKTAPGLRFIDKLAVRHGGGRNHRFGLFDMVLIKDNHIKFAESLSNAVGAARKSQSQMEIEVEVQSIKELEEALNLGVTRILLDNMSTDDMRRAVALNEGRAKLEASGNVTLANVRQIADTGVDLISIGALTHSAKTLDVSMQWVSYNGSTKEESNDSND